MRILFVCTGNICRSPTAEGVLRHALREAGLSHIEVDSAGTHGDHAGEAPDARSQRTALARGYDISAQRARRVTGKDFQDFDLILALDASHLAALKRIMPNDARAEVALFLPHARHPRAQEVPDPYYGSQQDFELTLQRVEEGVAGLVERLK